MKTNESLSGFMKQFSLENKVIRLGEEFASVTKVIRLGCRYNVAKLIGRYTSNSQLNG